MLPKVLRDRSRLDEIAQSLRQLSEPWGRGDKIKAAIGRAATAAGLSYTRTFDLWYRKARRVEEAERSAVLAALDRKHKEAARNEIHELRTRITRLESLLAQIDQDFDRKDVDAGRDRLRTLGGRGGAPDRTVAGRS